MTIEIRRRATVMGVVAVVATLLTVAYVWRTIDSATVWTGAVAVLLAGIAGLHAFQWFDARTPMMIADAMGLRVRLGHGWAGITWAEIERLEIDEPGGLGDGHVAVFADCVDGRIAESDAWAKINAATNRLLFDAPLVVPYGRTSTVSSLDLVEDLDILADGRCEIVLLDAEVPDEEPTVTLIGGTDGDEVSDADEHAVHADDAHESPDDEAADAEGEPELMGPTDNTSRLFASLDQSREAAGDEGPAGDDAESDDAALAPQDDATPDHDSDADGVEGPGAEDGSTADEAEETATSAGTDPEPASDPKPLGVAARERAGLGAALRGLRRLGRAGRPETAGATMGEREIAASASWTYTDGPRGLTVDGVSTLSSASARRADVTMPIGDAATDGSLALSPAQPDEQPTEPLPELRELRRPTEDESVVEPRQDEPDAASGNMALVIDATSDVTDRVMSHLMTSSPVQGAAAEEPAERERRAPRSPDHAVVIGSFLRSGRESQGWSVDDLAERTRIRPYVIESLEVDDFSPCGGDFYVRGHLRTLSRVLDLDADELVRRYDGLYSAPEVGAKQVLNADRATGGPQRRDGAPRWMGLAIVVLLLVLVWSLAKYVADTAVGSEPDTPGQVTGSPGIGDTRGVPVDLRASVRVTKKQEVIVRSRYGERLFRGTLKPGQVQRVRGAAPLKVRATQGRRVIVTQDGEKSRVGGDGLLVLRAPRGQATSQ